MVEEARRRAGGAGVRARVARGRPRGPNPLGHVGAGSVWRQWVLPGAGAGVHPTGGRRCLQHGPATRLSGAGTHPGPGEPPRWSHRGTLARVSHFVGLGASGCEFHLVTFPRKRVRQPPVRVPKRYCFRKEGVEKGGREGLLTKNAGGMSHRRCRGRGSGRHHARHEQTRHTTEASRNNPRGRGWG